MNIVNFALFKIKIRRELIYHAEFSRLEVIQYVYSKAEERTSLKYKGAICMCTYLLKIKRYALVLSIKELYIYFKIKIKKTQFATVFILFDTKENVMYSINLLNR